MNEALPANFRNNENDKYGTLRLIDIPAEVCRKRAVVQSNANDGQ